MVFLFKRYSSTGFRKFFSISSFLAPPCSGPFTTTSLFLILKQIKKKCINVNGPGSSYKKAGYHTDKNYFKKFNAYWSFVISCLASAASFCGRQLTNSIPPRNSWKKINKEYFSVRTLESFEWSARLKLPVVHCFVEWIEKWLLVQLT